MNSISPLDGRYRGRTTVLSKYFSESALIKQRLHVENRYLEFICGILEPEVDFKAHVFSEKDMNNAVISIKHIEKRINHDVKSVEYFLAKFYDDQIKPYIHIGLTSHDINSMSYSTLIKNYLEQVLCLKLDTLLNTLLTLGKNWNIPMLAKTHGQSATPTNLGKEIMVFHERLEKQLSILKKIEHSCKFGGANGGFNALAFAYPEVNWLKKLDEFCDSFNLKMQKYTTQISHYDNFSEIFDCVKRINTILIDLCQDVWLYCSCDYFKLKINKTEVGSSTMPHKVNPIDFENAEGNFKISSCLLNFFSEKLPVSRLQRDLTDSTVTRNIGVGFGHSYLGISSVLRGISKLCPNKQVIAKDLGDNWVILGEAVQTVLRKNGYVDGYDIIKKELRNGQKMNKDSYIRLVKKLDIEKEDKKRLLELTPEKYSIIRSV